MKVGGEVSCCDFVDFVVYFIASIVLAVKADSIEITGTAFYSF